VLVNFGGLIIANVIALAVALAWLAYLTLPYAQAVRVRNAFLLRRGHADDFSWTPAKVPADFQVEHRRAPAVIEAALANAGKSDVDDWNRAMALVTLLVRHWRHEGPIQADLTTTYHGIVAGGGYCADYVRVYLALAHAAGLFCRQWAFSFDGFGGHGHTFVEVYLRQQARWVFVDVFNNVCAYRPGTDRAVDALTVRNAVIERPASIEFRRAGEGRLGYAHVDKLVDYYRRGAAQWYLWWGNDVISRDSGGFAGALARVSGRLGHRLQSALGGLPPLVAMVTADNETQVARMEALRRSVRVALSLVVGLVLVLAGQIVSRRAEGGPA
jgi:hypothetical protein